MSEVDELYGPALPPGYKKTVNEELQIIGPQLPPRATEAENAGNDNPVIGPQLPPGFVRTPADKEESDDDDEIIGPLPYQGDGEASDNVKEEFDKRAQRMKNRLTGVTETKPVQREEWMTSLPANLKPTFGTGPRTFRQRNAPENTDTSAWTSIPGKDEEPKEAPKSKAADEGNEFLSVAKDQQLSEIIKDYNDKSRSQSLLEIHQENRKRKQNDEPKERRPFDRNIDLEHVRFDDAQRKALIKSSHQLNDRFSAGKAKFL